MVPRAFSSCLKSIHWEKKIWRLSEYHFTHAIVDRTCVHSIQPVVSSFKAGNLESLVTSWVTSSLFLLPPGWVLLSRTRQRLSELCGHPQHVRWTEVIHFLPLGLWYLAIHEQLGRFLTGCTVIRVPVVWDLSPPHCSGWRWFFFFLNVWRV